MGGGNGSTVMEWRSTTTTRVTTWTSANTNTPPPPPPLPRRADRQARHLCLCVVCTREVLLQRVVSFFHPWGFVWGSTAQTVPVQPCADCMCFAVCRLCLDVGTCLHYLF